MTRRQIFWVVLFAFLVGMVSLAYSQKEPLKRLKRRVAVFDFEDKTGHRWHWWTGQPVGQGMADMLVTALVKSGKYQVFERQEIGKIISEQKLGLAGAVTPETAAKVGKLLGVELAVIGSVTEFGYKKERVGGRIKGIGVGVKTSVASVGIDVRLINTTTGEILVAENVRKERNKKGLTLVTPKFVFKDQHEFDESLVGKATREAIEEIVRLIDTKIASIPWQARIIKAKPDGTVYINSGSLAGVQVGDIFTVYRKGEELIDPETGLSLGAEEIKIGTIQVIRDIAGGKASLAKVIIGSDFQRGDIVRVE